MDWSWITQLRYSRTSCQLECELERALSTSDCLPWYKIHINTIQNYKIHITAIEKELDQMFKGICHMTRRTTKRHAGYKSVKSTKLLTHNTYSQFKWDFLVPEEDEEHIRFGLRLPPGLWAHGLTVFCQRQQIHVSLAFVSNFVHFSTFFYGDQRVKKCSKFWK